MLVGLCWVLFKWWIGDFSTRGLMLVLILMGVLYPLFWVAKRFPLLGQAVGVLLIAAPIVAWGLDVFGLRRGGGDGSWGGLVVLVYWILALAVMGVGVLLIQTARDKTEYSDEDKVDIIRRAMGGD